MDSLIPIVLAALVFASITLVVSSLLAPRVTSARARLGSYGVGAPGDEALDKLALPFTTRIVAPLLASVARIVRSLSRAQIEQDVRTRIVQAGSPTGLDVNRFLAFRGLGLLAPPIFFVGPGLLAGDLSLSTMAIGLVAAAAGWRAPMMWLDARISSRRKAITRALPDALDLIIVCVEAGNSLEGALAVVSQRMSGPLAEELERTLREMSLGKGRQDALHDLAIRAASPDLRTFIAAVIQADQLGIGIASVLRVQGDAMRVRRRQRAEEQAAKTPVLMLLPLVGCILPALMIIIMGPIAVRILAFFSSSSGAP